MNCEDRNILIEKCLPEIELIARRFWHRLPPGVSLDDLEQQARLSMIATMDSGGVWTWARCYGVMADYLRDHAPARRDEMPREIASAESDPEELAIRSERRRIVQRMAADLPPREQAVLRLAARGVSGQELARTLRVGDRRARQLREQVVQRLTEAVA